MNGYRMDRTLLTSRDMQMILAGLLAWMLSCRDKVTVLEPERIREKLYRITSEIAGRYEWHGI